MYKHVKVNEIICGIVFLAIIFCGFIFSCPESFSLAKQYIYDCLSGEVRSASEKFEESYNFFLSSSDVALDSFSLLQRLLDKHEVRNFQVLRAADDTLYLQDSGWPTDKETLDDIIDQYILLKDTTQSYGGKFLYVQVPYKNAENIKSLKYYTDDKTETTENYFVKQLEKKGINVLDLREYDECLGVYRTDHHWKVESGFYASRVITESLNELYNAGIDNGYHYGNVDNYSMISYPNSFLGSIGIKVGKNYVGKDDFSVYNPDFPTELHFFHYINGECTSEYSGDFWTAFMDDDILRDSNYNNKYEALLHGAYVETIIKNNLADNEYKVLLISHSYGRPLAQYLCLNFSELRYLDPQKGRYNQSYVEYIKKYEPDYVILMYNDLVNVD